MNQSDNYNYDCMNVYLHNIYIIDSHNIKPHPCTTTSDDIKQKQLVQTKRQKFNQKAHHSDKIINMNQFVKINWWETFILAQQSVLEVCNTQNPTIQIERFPSLHKNLFSQTKTNQRVHKPNVSELHFVYQTNCKPNTNKEHSFQENEGNAFLWEVKGS